MTELFGVPIDTFLVVVLIALAVANRHELALSKEEMLARATPSAAGYGAREQLRR